MRERWHGDGILRFGYQNARGVGVHRGLDAATEINMMQEMGVNAQGLGECNKPWTDGNKSLYDHIMGIIFENPRTIYSSAPLTTLQNKYQRGGTLLSLVGTLAGRVKRMEGDPCGRYCWASVMGKRDEGILIVSGYRVCQDSTSNAGPFTAYQQQCTFMREAGQSNPNPRRQFFKDLLAVIGSQREKGYRPIIMLDANGDWNRKDTDFRDFLRKSNLVDAFYEKFRESPRTYMYSKNRLDYILVDRALCSAITAIGYCGTHSGAHSDPVYAYMDMDEERLLGGL